jgi:hypothetical protein
VPFSSQSLALSFTWKFNVKERCFIRDVIYVTSKYRSSCHSGEIKTIEREQVSVLMDLATTRIQSTLACLLRKRNIRYRVYERPHILTWCTLWSWLCSVMREHHCKLRIHVWLFIQVFTIIQAAHRRNNYTKNIRILSLQCPWYGVVLILQIRVTVLFCLRIGPYKHLKTNLNSVTWVLELIIPTERPPLFGEASAHFCG